MQDKLSLRPELEPVVDWCMAWIRETRRAVAIPTHKAMLQAWEAEKAKNRTNPIYNCLLTPKYAQDQCAVHWKHFLAYEKTLNAADAAATEPGSQKHDVRWGATATPPYWAPLCLEPFFHSVVGQGYF